MSKLNAAISTKECAHEPMKPTANFCKTKCRNFADFTSFEGVVINLIPTQKTFSEALSTIEAPLRALMDAINPMDFDQPALPAIKEVLTTYLDQLDYLLRWSRINGHQIGEAKIEHPFWILELE